MDAPRPHAAAPERPGVLGVRAVVGRIQSLIEGGFRGGVTVEGEVTGARISPTGHAYFDLVEGDARLPAVMFRGSMRGRRPEALHDGSRARATGRITIYPRGGRYQIIVNRLEHAGVGELLVALERLKRRLGAEGLFDADRKQLLPLLPRAVGVVTSPTGAAIRDIVRTLHARYPLPILLYPARVQGVESPEEVVRGIEVLDRVEDIDVIIIGRGGGSLEDLFGFNDERVVRTVAAASTPIVSAVGHEVDVVLTDLAADVRAATPTAAAEAVVPDRMELLARVAELRGRVLGSTRRRVDRARLRRDGLAGRLRDPSTTLASHAQRLDDLGGRMRRRVASAVDERRAGLASARRHLAALDPARGVAEARTRLRGLAERLERRAPEITAPRMERLEGAARALRSLSPEAHLERGYALVQHSTGLIRDAEAVAIGEEARVLLWRGALKVRVEEKGAGPFDPSAEEQAG